MNDNYFRPKNPPKEFKKDKTRTFHENFVDLSLFIWGIPMLENQQEEIKNRAQAIQCTCPVHGSFSTTGKQHVSSLLSGGCPDCYNEWFSNERRMPPEKLLDIKKKIELVFDILGDFNPKNNKDKIAVRCKTCSNESTLRLTNFVQRGDGCKKCSCKRMGKQFAMGNKTFIERAREVHGNSFEYSNIEYLNAHTKVEVICKQHGSFFVSPAAHIHSGVGCPSCSNEIFYGTHNGTISLYLIEGFDDDERFMKVGITKNVKKRFRQFPYEYVPLFVMTGDFETLFNVEQQIHYSQEFKKYRPTRLRNGGRTECYNIQEKSKLIDHMTQMISNVVVK